jgi:hypothetical protein
MHAPKSPKLIFKEEFDERLAFDVAQKGWCGIAMVELPEGGRVDVFFYDPTRLAQDLEVDAKAGHPYVAEPGLIVIPEVTLPYMEAAVEQLYKQGYFKRLVHSNRPITH